MAKDSALQPSEVEAFGRVVLVAALRRYGVMVVGALPLPVLQQMLHLVKNGQALPCNNVPVQ